MAEGTRKRRSAFENDVRAQLVGQSYDSEGATRGIVDDILATIPAFTQVSGLGDDSAQTETPVSSKGILIVTYDSGGSSDDGSTIHAVVAFDADNGAQTEISSGGNVTVNTSSLGGTDGSDNDFTIGIQSDGTIDFENRRGSAITFSYATIGPA